MSQELTKIKKNIELSAENLRIAYENLNELYTLIEKAEKRMKK